MVYRSVIPPLFDCFWEVYHTYAYTCVHSNYFSSICFGGEVVGEKILCSVKHTSGILTEVREKKVEGDIDYSLGTVQI